jgi:hypothetical protein
VSSLAEIVGFVF